MNEGNPRIAPLNTETSARETPQRYERITIPAPQSVAPPEIRPGEWADARERWLDDLRERVEQAEDQILTASYREKDHALIRYETVRDIYHSFERKFGRSPNKKRSSVRELAGSTGYVALDAQIAGRSLEELRLHYRNLLIDTSEDDTAVRQLAAQVLTDFEINGDSYGVPSVVDIVETLVARVKRHNVRTEVSIPAGGATENKNLEGSKPKMMDWHYYKDDALKKRTTEPLAVKPVVAPVSVNSSEWMDALAGRLERRLAAYKEARPKVLPFNGDEAFTVAMSILIEELRACSVSASIGRDSRFSPANPSVNEGA